MSDKSKMKTIIPFFHMQVPLATAYRATSNQKPYRIKTSEKKRREEKRREEKRKEEKRREEKRREKKRREEKRREEKRREKKRRKHCFLGRGRKQKRIKE